MVDGSNESFEHADEDLNTLAEIFTFAEDFLNVRYAISSIGKIPLITHYGVSRQRELT